MIRRRGKDGGHDPDPREPDPPAGDPSGPAPQPPPDIVFHLYGLNWDVSDPGGAGRDVYLALTDAASALAPDPGILIDFRTDYDFGLPTLSFGIWRTPMPTDPRERSERQALLAETRTMGHQSGFGEIKIAAPVLTTFIASKIPSTVVQDGVTGVLESIGTSQIAPCGLAIAVSYTLQIEQVYPTVTCSTTLSFDLANGSVFVSLSRIDCGDYGLFNAFLANLFTPGVFQLLETALLALTYVMVQRIGNGLAALPSLAPPVPIGSATAQLFRREIVAGPLKLPLTYQAPRIEPETSAFWFPFNWVQPVFRMPSVRVQGPTALTTSTIDAEEASGVYHATTADLVDPTLTWSLDRQTIDSGTDVLLVNFDAVGTRVGQSKTFVVSVVATDGVTPMTASAALAVKVSVKRPVRL